MKKLIIISLFVAFIINISVGQINVSDDLKISNVGNDNGRIGSVYSDFEGVSNIFNNKLNGGTNKPSNIFNVESIGLSSRIENELSSNISYVESAIRVLPIGLSLNNISNFVNSESSYRDIAMKILNDKAVKEGMKISSSKSFKIINISEEDEFGMVHIKLNQYKKGSLIFGGQIIIHIKKGKNIENPSAFINGRWMKEQNEEKKGSLLRETESASDFLITSQEARQVVANLLSSNEIKLRSLSKLAAYLIKEERWQVKKVYYPIDNWTKLIPAYEVSVIVDPIHRYKYIVDAMDSKVVVKHDMHCSFVHESASCPPDGGTTAVARDLNGVNRTLNVYEKNGTYYLLDVSRSMFNSSASNLPDEPQGTIWTIDANNTHPNNNNFNNNLRHVVSNNNSWVSKTSVSAHYNAGFAYDYFKNVHGRNSIDGNGGNIISIINVSEEDGNGMDNAFWGGKAMYYGNGNHAFTSPLARALDVSGHELTHGVIQSTANLEYFDESGAINESFADIFGAMMDRDNWKMGEDVVNKSVYASGALRDLSNPHNGSATNDYGSGFQPANTSEQYKGDLDNHGVHINSGIPNFAFYKFATAVGKDKAEKVYYRALVYYLTKSSNFEDLRVAIEKAAEDIYGENVKKEAGKAFAAVGIGEAGSGSGGHGGGSKETDLSVNPGTDFVLCTGDDGNNMYLFSSAGELLKDPFVNTSLISKPSITDDGKHIVFVGNDNKIHYVYLEWNGSSATAQESIIQDSPNWKSAIISKDGSHIAALTKDNDNKVYVYDYTLGKWHDFILKNPTSADGIELGNVVTADAMEFDYSGEWIMYDCYNEISSTNSYWDIGFINVWDNSKVQFAEGRTTKLFSSLSDNVSVGNPSFSKNSPYIITFDYIEGSKYYCVGANVEKGNVEVIYENANVNYPNYSKLDNKVIFNYKDQNSNNYIGIVDVDQSKIKAVPNTAKYLNNYYGLKWGVWFSNGVRELIPTSTDDFPDVAKNTFIYPNPISSGIITIESLDFESEVHLEVFNTMGKKLIDKRIDFISNNIQFDVSDLCIGNYLIRINDGENYFVGKFNKVK